MATLNIATRANQASTLPVLLVAQYAKECDQKVSIKVNFEDVNTLKSGDNASVELIERSGVSSFGYVRAIHGLISMHPLLQGRNENIVSVVLNRVKVANVDKTLE